MVPKRRTLRVIYSDKALEELDETWIWNAKTYDGRHATDYAMFLRQQIDALSDTYANGKEVNIQPGWRYVIFKRSIRGYGHVVVYRYDDNAVTVLRILHTSRDWLNILSEWQKDNPE